MNNINTININTSKRIEIIDITPNILQFIKEQKISEGICSIFVPHTTAAVTINENADPTVVKDMLNTLNKLIPHQNNYLHSEGNSDAHIKASLVGASEVIFIQNGKLMLGTWQGIFFCEFDGPRSRKVWIKFLTP
ncbi:secondary thiamine-phosphate synthase enzyme YjbQ [Peptococcaceae bacterium]|nr:secondary thiamine-phosphate synthase enzyme YjbQ [Peptococcaceae bacterium]